MFFEKINLIYFSEIEYFPKYLCFCDSILKFCQLKKFVLKSSLKKIAGKKRLHSELKEFSKIMRKLICEKFKILSQ